MNKLSEVAIATLLAAALGGCTPTPEKPPMQATGMPGHAMMGPGGGNFDMHMRQMQEMHTRMMAAKTPEERQALRAEHHKAMRGGMAAMHEHMGAMGSQCTPEMMERHRNMMHMMMQMMEETPVEAGAGKK
jgi:predicted lipoprotein